MLIFRLPSCLGFFFVLHLKKILGLVILIQVTSVSSAANACSVNVLHEGNLTRVFGGKCMQVAGLGQAT